METKSNSTKPLKFVCPCGYRKRLPEKFAGKKLVCPKCNTTLRIERLVKVAKVLLHCPYCKETSNFKHDRSVCKHCNREFELPEHLATRTQSQTPAPMALAVAPPATVVATPDSEDSFPIKAEPSVRAVADDPSPAYPKHRSLFSSLMFNLMGIALTGVLAFLTWDKYGEQLGIRDGASSQSQSTAPSRPSPKPQPFDPSIEILDFSSNHLQRMERTGFFEAKLIEERWPLKPEIQNNGPYDITKIKMSVNFFNGLPEKTKTFDLTDDPIKRSKKRALEIPIDDQEIAKATVKVLEVWAGELFSPTDISKTFIIDK